MWILMVNGRNQTWFVSDRVRKDTVWIRRIILINNNRDGRSERFGWIAIVT